MKTQNEYRTISPTGIMRQLLFTLCLISASISLYAQGGGGSYDAAKKFNFMPKGDVVRGTWRYYSFTSASSPSDRCGPLNGTEAMPANDSKDCASRADHASSKSHSGIATSKFAPGNVSGSIAVKGNATASGGPGSAFSAARSGVSVQGGKKMRSGRISWGPSMSTQVLGNSSSFAHDPIGFDVFDPDTNTHTTGTLFSVDAFMGGAGSFSWQNDVFNVNATNFDFTLQLNSPYTSEQGTVDFHIRGGIVTASTETGMFAGLLPGIGTGGAFSVPFSDDFTLDYDLGNLGGNNPDVSVSFDEAGQAAAGTPEPSSMLLLGSGLLSLSGILRKRHSREVRERRSLAE